MKPEYPDTSPDSATRGTASRGPGPQILASHSLLGGHRQVQIDHQGERYVLRVTRHGKLILTK